MLPQRKSFEMGLTTFPKMRYAPRPYPLRETGSSLGEAGLRVRTHPTRRGDRICSSRAGECAIPTYPGPDGDGRCRLRFSRPHDQLIIKGPGRRRGAGKSSNGFDEDVIAARARPHASGKSGTNALHARLQIWDDLWRRRSMGWTEGWSGLGYGCSAGWIFNMHRHPQTERSAGTNAW